MRLPPRWLAEPRVLRRVHAVATLVWIALAVPTLLLWRDSVLWVALMSVWANVAGHWSAWQATRVEDDATEDDDDSDPSSRRDAVDA